MIIKMQIILINFLTPTQISKLSLNNMNNDAAAPIIVNISNAVLVLRSAIIKNIPNDKAAIKQIKYSFFTQYTPMSPAYLNIIYFTTYGFFSNE